MNKRIKLIKVGTIDIEGNVHRINLHDGLNVITGSKGTGKTTILEIIDFCFGKKTGESIPKEIRDISKHHFLECYTDNKSNSFILSRSNIDNKFVLTNLKGTYSDSTIKNVIESSKRISWPELNVLLFEKKGLAAEKISQLYGKDRIITFRNAMTFCFQPSHLVNNKEILLYRTEDKIKLKSLIEELPLLLGITNFNHYYNVNSLNTFQDKYNRLKKRHDYIVETRSYDNINFLLRQLSTFTGNAVNTEEIKSFDDFKRIQSNLDFFDGSIDSIPVLEIADIYSKKSNLETQMINTDHELASISTQLNNFHNLSAQLNIQQEQQIFIEQVLPSLELDDELISSFSEARSQLNLDLDKLNLNKNGYLNKRFNDLTLLKNSLISLHREHSEQLNDLLKIYDKTSSFKERQKEYLKLIAKIELEFELIENELTKLSTELLTLKQDIARLNELVKVELIKINDSKSAFQIAISLYLDEELKYSFPEFGYANYDISFDLAKMNIYYSSVKTTPVYLSGWGSDHNYLFAHVSAMLSIHRTLANFNKTTIPAFIVFDQISRGYFPDTEDITESSDTQNLRKIYDLIVSVINEASKNDSAFQVIAIEHANFGMSSNYENAKIRDDNGNKVTFKDGLGYIDKNKFSNIKLQEKD